MTEKELKRSATGSNLKANIYVTLKLIFDLLPQILIVYLISLFFESKIEQGQLSNIFVMILLSFILKGLFYYLSTKTAHSKAYTTLAELRLKIINHLKNLRLGFFKEHSTGELTNIISHDVEQIEIYLAHGLPEIMAATILPLICFITILFIDYRLALIMLSGLPLMTLIQMLSAKTMERGLKGYFKHENQMREEIMEYVKNISTIKSFSKEEELSNKTLKTAKEYIVSIKKSMGGFTIPTGLIDIFMEIGVVLVISLGAILLIKDEITAPKYILSIILSSFFTASISKTATLHHFQMVFKNSISNIGKILNTPLKEALKQEKLTMGDIHFENVDFYYEQDGFNLENINLCFKQNSTNALIGASGSGKSTITNLLMGFWQVNKGKITINGKDISQYDQDNIMSLISNVSQDVTLFNTSIFENIALGKVNASRQEVIEAAKKAKIHNFIASLPKGYETNIGEMGVKLSGGEKQRMSIARAFLKAAPILILDEALAAIDKENENLILESINKLKENKTVITVSHRLNTIKNTNQIILMDKGKIVDFGTDKQLVARCKLYQKMLNAQNKVESWCLKEEEV